MPKRRRKPKQAAPPQLSGQWDTCPAIQLARRAYRVTERGETDPETGEVRNPNGVTGVRFLSEWARLDDRLQAAAEAYEDLRRRASGSPAQRSCLDFSPLGHDDPEPDRAAVKLLGRVRARLTPVERQEIDRVCWEGERARWPFVLAQALRKAADEMGVC